MCWRRLVSAALVAGLALLTVPATATAAAQEGIGHRTKPQPYAGKPPGGDWLGTYVWQSKHVWCVQYSLKAPDSNVPYQPGDELLTKAGAKLSPEVAANISYLLLRYSTTVSADEAAALAHLLHSWTAFEDKDRGLTKNPSADFRHIAYDEQFHFNDLPQSAKDAVTKLRADAETNRGPWGAAVTAPTTPQLIGTPGDWTVQITKTDKKGVAGVPVTVELTDATLEDGTTTATLTTPVDGKPLVVKAVPTGAKPTFVVKLDSPADKPVVHVPQGDNDMQRIVTTGGEKKLTANATTAARTAPGIVKITKTDVDTKAAIAGVSLRVTGADKTTPAVKQDDSPLVGPDNKPIVLQTGSDGAVTVPNLKTPQKICLIEISAAKGYNEFFDPKAPPTVCGTVGPGQKLELTLVNKPNKPVVPSVIPAGVDGQTPVATAAVITKVEPVTLVGFGGLVLLVAALTGVFIWRRQ